MAHPGRRIHGGAMPDQVLSHPAAVPATPSATRVWRTEDWIAVVLGFLVIAEVLLTFQWKVPDLRGVVPSFRWTTNEQIELLTPNWTKALDSISHEADAKGQQNIVTLSRDLMAALATADHEGRDARARDARAGRRRDADPRAGHNARGRAP